MRRNEPGREGGWGWGGLSQAEGTVWVNTRDGKELGVFKIREGEANMMGSVTPGFPAMTAAEPQEQQKQTLSDY